MNDILPVLSSFLPLFIVAALFAVMWWRDFGFTRRQRMSRGYLYKQWKEDRERANSKTYDRLREQGKDVAKGDYLRTDVDAFIALEDEKQRQEIEKATVIRENARL